MNSLICNSFAHANTREKVIFAPEMPLTLECIIEVSQKAQVPLAILLGILATENGQIGIALSNKNGTWDMGPFQINTVHINALESLGIVPKEIITNACINAYAAGWVLSKELIRSKDIWEAVGAYHSRTPFYHERYIGLVKNNIMILHNKQRVRALLEYINGLRRHWK